MARRNESPFEILLKLPWWVSVVLGLITYSAIRWGLPLWAGDDPFGQGLKKGIVPQAHFALILFGAIALVSFIFGLSRRRLVDQQTSLDSLRDLPWKQFEFLVAEAFRRQGYQVDFSLGSGADGGIDLVLQRDGHTSLVQCKQWRTYSVGAPVVREMFGLMVAENADEVIIVTSGHFTRDAEAFAQDKPIRLINGPELLALVRSVQTSPPDPSTINEQPSSNTTTPSCPQCGQPMVLRTARRGKNAGNEFWGCPTYPTCNGTRSIDP